MSDILDQLPDTAGPAQPIAEDRVAHVLANIVRDLQVTPRRYRWFGVWWWPLKAILRRAGYGPNLPWLGAAMDAEALATLPPLTSIGQVLGEALRDYQWAARLDQAAEWRDAPNGDRIRIYDPDVET